MNIIAIRVETDVSGSADVAQFHLITRHNLSGKPFAPYQRGNKSYVKLLLLLSMLLISRSKDLWKILMSDWWTVVSIFFDLQLPPLAPNIFSCLSNHLGAVFFFFLLLSLPSSVLQWHHEGGNFFSEYERSNWFFYVGYYLEVSSSLLYGQELFH